MYGARDWLYGARDWLYGARDYLYEAREWLSGARDCPYETTALQSPVPWRGVDGTSVITWSGIGQTPGRHPPSHKPASAPTPASRTWAQRPARIENLPESFTRSIKSLWSGGITDVNNVTQ